MEEKLTLYDSISRYAKLTPYKTAIVYENKKISFKKLIKRIDKMAAILKYNYGIGKGDVVLISQPNIPYVIVATYAVNKIGGVCNMVHPYTPYNQIVNIIKNTNSKLCIMFEQRIAKEVDRYRDLANKIFVTRIEDDLPIFKKIIYHCFLNKNIRRKLGRYRGSFKGFNYIKDMKKSSQKVEAKPFVDKQISFYLHSGSTTGDPKTICLCDENFNYIADNIDFMRGTKKGETKNEFHISFLPSFHGFGFCMTMHTPLFNGEGVVLLPKFSPEAINKIINRYKIQIICGVPTVFETLYNYLPFRKNKNMKYIRGFYCGGDNISIKLKENITNLLKSHGSKGGIFVGYGLTEAVAVNCCNTPYLNCQDSIGYPLPKAKFRIVKEDGLIAKPNEVGEITISSPAVMVGYLNDKENDKYAIRDGWLYTGDYGHINEDGFIFFDQRKKRVIKVSGVGVFPTEVEKLVQSIHEVKACCAISIPDDKLQHAIKLFVVAEYFDEEGMRQKIMEICGKYLIRWSVPKEIEFVDELPCTLLGKVDFNKLQQLEDKKRGISNEKK